jgi:ABC-type multidrug transport system ATPase subunit
VTGPALELRGVGKSFEGRPALRGLSFAVAEGESVGYLGPNGAGKSTTLRLLAGLSRPDRGEVRVFERPAWGRGDAAPRELGALIETPGLTPFLRGRDLLEYAAELRGLSRLERPAAVRRAAERLGVEDHVDRNLGSLSTGWARRVLLAVALVGDPKVLLLDEPTLGLDPAARLDLRTTIRGLCEQGQTLLLSTHVLEDVQAVCDRVLFLREGRLAGDEPVPRAPNSWLGDRLRCRFLREPAADLLHDLIRAPEQAQFLGPRELLLSGLASPDRQAELLEAFCRNGWSLLEAVPVGADLESRYLRAVGREEDV